MASKQTNPAKPQPWPYRARQVATDDLRAWNKVARHACELEMLARSDDGWAAQVIEILRLGDTVGAIQALQNVRSLEATRRHVTHEILSTASESAVRIQGALIGEYDGVGGKQEG